MNKLTIVTTALLLTGCMAPTNVKQYTETDAGTAPVNYQAAINKELQETLKVPDSIKDFSTEKPKLGKCSGYWKTQNFVGWRVKTSYNAKNSYGAYAGKRDYYYWFNGEKLMTVSESTGYCPDARLWGR